MAGFCSGYFACCHRSDLFEVSFLFSELFFHLCDVKAYTVNKINECVCMISNFLHFHPSDHSINVMISLTNGGCYLSTVSFSFQ